MKRLVAFLACCLMIGFAQAQSRSLPDFADLAEKQGGAVVNISTVQAPRGRSSPSPLDESDPAFELFRRFFPKLPGAGPAPREFENRSLGSGFVIGGDGHILTNAHVIEGADEVVVRLTDKREFKARVVGADKRSDVAVIKIEASGLPVVRLGNPEKLRVGEWVVAIGSPFGFDNSVTAGIVSAKGRALPLENYVPFIQTDVAINPGNSGGPLFNMAGEVIGINSQIYSRSGGYMGVSFAIPIDVAMDIQQQLRTGGKVNRGRLGVVIQEVSRELAESLGLSRPQGAVVNAVEADGPAAKAGIETGDVILRFDGKAINASAELPRLVAATPPGTRSNVQVWRKGRLRDLTVVVGKIADDEPAIGRASPSAKATAPGQASNRFGLVVSELAAEQRREAGIDGGLLIEEVRVPAARADLQSGDIIVAVISRGTPNEVKTVDQFNRLLATFDKGSAITLLIRRGKLQNFVTIRGSNGH